MPQYNNPYHIEPANLSLGFDKALAGVQQGIETRKVTKQTAEDKKAMSDFAENFENFTPIEVGQYVLNNPRVGKFITDAVDTTSKMTNDEKLADAVEVAKAYLTGDQGVQPQLDQPAMSPVQPIQPPAVQPTIGLDNAPVGPVPIAPVDPAGQVPVVQPEAGQVLSGKDQAVKVLTSHVQENLQRGGNSTEGIELVRDAMTGGEKAFKGAMATIAALDPQTFDRLMELQSGGDVGSTPDTDSDDYVADSLLVFDSENPDATEPERAKARKEARIEYKRIQAGEARDITKAKTDAQLQSELEGKPKVEASIISAKEAAKLSNEAYGKLSTIKTNIGNLREGITLLKEGAGTGAVESKLPSVRAASVKLDNLQGRLGLDVLHSTTFGALSAAELKFALSTALPQGLDRDELMDWMTEKADAQEKLHDYIEGAAIYLGKPGNTPSGWIERNRNTRMEAENQLPAGVTEDDIKTTMQNNNMTREQVLARLAGR